MSTAVVCPACETLSDGRLDLRTLDRTGDVLACACGARYPVVDDVPIVLRDPTAYLRDEALAVVERDLPPEVAALLVASQTETAPYAHLLEHLSTYLDAHWGDRAEPPPDGPGAGFALAALVDRLAALPRVAAAVELGCSAGRIVAELARSADHVVALDLQFAAVRRARALLAGRAVAYCRRRLGQDYVAASAMAGDRAAANVTLLCGNALDPPLVPRSYDRVVAFNLLDSVHRPRLLLSVLDGLCATGGEVILGSPYSWQGAITAPEERLTPAMVRAILTGGELTARYEIVDEAELPWILRRDARSTVTYQIDYVRARKL